MEDVQVGEFGNEGSGGQSWLIYPWKTGVKYSFIKSVEPDGNGNTIYTAYFKDPEEGDWRLIASFLRPQTDTWFAGPYSFLENFKPEEGYKLRKAYYSPQLVSEDNLMVFTTHSVPKVTSMKMEMAPSERKKPFPFLHTTDGEQILIVSF